MAPEKRPVHMVANAHIDPVWLWQWPEGLHEVRATFASALDRMEEYPELVFSPDSVAYLAWIEEIEPAMFERIRARVAEGRWELLGGWWIEPDCNIPSGESLVRQGLYGQRFLAARFGVTATVGCNVDPFGHNATLPQILSKSGLDAYVFLRPEPSEKALPAACFRWRSEDGSSVIAYRIPHGYCSPGSDLRSFVDHAVEKFPATDGPVMVFYGVGNHGGGPTRANLDSIRSIAQQSPDLAPRCTRARELFDIRSSSSPQLPTYSGELQHHSVGCYSAHSGVKRWNRRAESMLGRAEKLATLAAATAGAAYPGDELAQAWKLVLFNQFHDTLAGTAIEPAYEDSRDQYGHACSIAAAIANRATQAIAARIDIPAEEEMVAVVVVNPLPWDVSAAVELELEWLSDNEVRVAEAAGAAVPVQRVQSRATVGPRHRRLAIAAKVPALGYRVYRVLPATQAPPLPPETPPTVLDNGVVRAEVDAGTGWLGSLVRLAGGAEVVPEAPSPHAVVIRDGSDTWGHGVERYDDIVGHFTCKSVRRVEHGPVRSVVRIESTFASSTLVEDLVLAAGASHLEVRASLDWHERHRLLKLRFPCSLASSRATFAVPYGCIERPDDGHEEVAQAWVDVSGFLAGGEPAGLSVINDGKYAYDVLGAEIGMTVARSPVYAWHDPRVLDPEEEYHYLDQGRQEFTYALVPHGGAWREAGTVRLAEALNQPLAALPEHFHAGELPSAYSFASGDETSVVLSVLKRCEDGGGTIVRAYETARRSTDARIRLGFLGRSIEATFGPGELKTFFVPDDDGVPASEVSLLEWPLDTPLGAVGRRAAGEAG